MYLAKLHMCMTQLKPFNPILGETFQAKIGKNTIIYMEQTSHHPPIYNFLILNPNYKCYGYEEPRASTGANNVTAKSYGKFFIEFNDGFKYFCTHPELKITGTLYGDRTFQIRDQICVEDLQNDYVGIVKFNPNERGFFDKITFSKSKHFPDYFRAVITRKSQCQKSEKKQETIFTPLKNHTKLIEFSGNWGTHIELEDEIIWQRNQSRYEDLLRTPYTLPSDCTLRTDLIALRNNKTKEAQNEKTKLEEIQRNDRKLRANFNKKNKNKV